MVIHIRFVFRKILSGKWYAEFKFVKCCFRNCWNWYGVAEILIGNYANDYGYIMMEDI